MILKGKIIKGIGGFYYVHTSEGEFECRARGIFRNRNEKPLVGDWAEIETVPDSEKERTGNVVRILPRKNRMIRPEVSNVDQAVIVFSLKNPDPNFSLLDRFLINMDRAGIPCRIVFNKNDLEETPAERAEAARMKEVYEQAGYPVLSVNTREESFQRELLGIFQGKTSVLSGPSGVGKSSMINFICPGAEMETGGLSRIRRGRNTTRHTELFCLDDESFVLDTPGFASLELFDVEPEKLMYFYREFEAFRSSCRYNTCIHIGEPLNDCAVKRAVKEGKIARERYDSYRQLYQELKDSRRF